MTIRRMKNYSAQTGFVYQYYFVGSRRTDGGETEYIFDVTSDRHTLFALSIVVRQQALEDWASVHGRPLGDTERYACAKLRLQKAFDENPHPEQGDRRFEVTAENIEELLEPLALD